MTTPTPPQASPVPGAPQPHRPRPARRLRPGYLASLICLTVTVVLAGTLLVLGPEVPHPEPDFIGGPTTEGDIEIEVGEDDLGEVAGFALEGAGGACVLYTPSGEQDSGDPAMGPTVYGAQGWTVQSIYQIEEAGTHLFQCSSDDEMGIAPAATTVDAAQTRQLVWALLWLSVPVLTLATAAIAVTTLIRGRRQRAAHPSGR